MPIRDLAELTWEEARDLADLRPVALLPVGALEAHGPHLPLATDVIIAEAWARAGAAALAADGITVVLLPSLAFTPAPFAAGFAGTLSVEPAAITAQVSDLAATLTRQGFAALGIANAHLDPANLGALHAAEVRCRTQGTLPVAFPDITRKPWATRLGEEFRSGACHAGRFEASVVMAARPELVRDAVRLALPPNPRSLSTAIREGHRTFEEAGGPQGYFGWPADASVAEGRARLDALGGILAEAVRAALAPEPAA